MKLNLTVPTATTLPAPSALGRLKWIPSLACASEYTQRNIERETRDIAQPPSTSKPPSLASVRSRAPFLVPQTNKRTLRDSDSMSTLPGRKGYHTRDKERSKTT